MFNYYTALRAGRDGNAFYKLFILLYASCTIFMTSTVCIILVNLYVCSIH